MEFRLSELFRQSESFRLSESPKAYNLQGLGANSDCRNFLKKFHCVESVGFGFYFSWLWLLVLATFSTQWNRFFHTVEKFRQSENPLGAATKSQKIWKMVKMDVTMARRKWGCRVPAGIGFHTVESGISTKKAEGQNGKNCPVKRLAPCAENFDAVAPPRAQRGAIFLRFFAVFLKENAPPKKFSALRGQLSRRGACGAAARRRLL